MRMKTTMIGVLLLFSVAFARAENRPNHPRTMSSLFYATT